MTTEDPYNPPVPGEPSLLENPMAANFPMPPMTNSLPTQPEPSMVAPDVLQQPTVAPDALQQSAFPYAYYNMYAAYNPWMNGMVPFPMMLQQDMQMSPSFYQNFNGMGSPSFISPMPSPGYQMPPWTAGTIATNTNASKDKKEKKFAGKKFSADVENRLIERYNRYKFIRQPERDQLAATLGLDPLQVKIWFQNRRYKLKKRDESVALANAVQFNVGRPYNGHTEQQHLLNSNPYSPSEAEWQENMPPVDPEMF